MKIMIRLLTVSLLWVLLTSYQPIQAELLVVKQTETGFAALDDSDNANIATIEKILLKYQWPMSAIYALEPFNKGERDSSRKTAIFSLPMNQMQKKSGSNKRYKKKPAIIPIVLCFFLQHSMNCL